HRPDESRWVGQIKALLRPWLVRIGAKPVVPSWQRSFALLRRHGLSPATVFDIGVAFGTYELYRAFPDAHYHLIDPTPESLHYMRRLSHELRCDIHGVALGDRDGTAAIEIRPDIQAATLFEDNGARDVVRRDTVPMRRFDSLIGRFERPALCKIDVQGAELMVLEGMTGRIAEIDAFVIEASTLSTLKGGVELADIVLFMQRHGFAVADVLGLVPRPLDGATAHIDLMFLPQHSAARADRRWAAD
ncbi:MAG TPA: FkbM family methyltransferase, partial [Reyranella sp.]|nr:FkbM family methyltransferase [Reyranella sp.]